MLCEHGTSSYLTYKIRHQLDFSLIRDIINSGSGSLYTTIFDISNAWANKTNYIWPILLLLSNMNMLKPTLHNNM